MVTTLRKLIKAQRINLEDTVYSTARNTVLNFPLSAGPFFKLERGTAAGLNFYQLLERDRAYREACVRAGAACLEEQIAALEKQALLIRTTVKGEEKKKRLSELKALKKPVAAELEGLKEQCLLQIAPEKDYLIFKDRAVVTDFDNLCLMLPRLKMMDSSGMEETPWLACGLLELKSAGTPGLVGGPCLFGKDEVLMKLETKSGESRIFDLSCGRSCQSGGEFVGPSKEDPSLAEYLAAFSGEMKSVRLVDQKRGITRQEMLSIKYLLEFSRALSGKAVIPLPDLSYLKYMEADTAGMEEPLRARIMGEFEKIAFRITDLYIQWIRRLLKQYPSVEVKILHARDQELCRIFYEKRAPYLRDPAVIRRLTKLKGRREAVLDYITMLALPYYLYGTQHILQVDSMDETDSGRKCQKIHKKDITLCSVLYPELLSRDGLHTIYHAAQPYKEYI